MTDGPRYLHLPPGSAPPRLDLNRFKAVLVIDSAVTAEWQAKVSAWLVESGCRYMLAWGVKCSEWDDSVDIACLERFDFGEVPDEASVMTSWHDGETLEDVFFFAEHCDAYSPPRIPDIVIVHIGETARQRKILKRFRKGQDQK